MPKSLEITIAFWLNFLVSPIFAYMMNGMIFFQLFDSGTLPFVKPELMPWLTLVTFIWILIASDIWIGILVRFKFVSQPILNNRLSTVTKKLGVLEIVLLAIGNVLRLAAEAASFMILAVNDIAVVTALPLLIGINYQFWQSRNRRWVLIGVGIQSLVICLFMQGFYSSVW